MNTLLVLLAFIAVAFAQQCPRCTPHCTTGDGFAKTCGEDGCGNTCGTCSAGQECCRGSCVCMPNCAGRVCGDDGCGGSSCGTCASGQTCSNGVCVGTGTANCAGKVCGSDGMFGNCGSCATGQRCRGGQCECYYDCNDRNCGLAPQVAGSVCAAQSCGTCPTGFDCGTDGRCSALAPCEVDIIVVDGTNGATITGTCSIDIMSQTTTYQSLGYTWFSPSTTWDVGGGFGAYDFMTTCQGYTVSTEVQTVSTTTTTVILTVMPAPIPVEVYEAGDFTQQLAETCQIEVTGDNFFFTTFSWVRNTGVMFSGVSTNGFGTYEFTTSCPGYSVSIETKVLTAQTQVIQLVVAGLDLIIEVRNRYPENNQQLISVSASIAISFGGVATQTYSWSPGQVNLWSPSAGMGEYQFVTTAAGFDVSRETRQVVSGVSVVTLYVSGCGDGVCADGETWDFCFADCAALFLQFETHDSTTPVLGFTVSLFTVDPRNYETGIGPVRNSEVADTVRTVEDSTNVFYQGTFAHNDIIFVEVVIDDFIPFYWRADLGIIDPILDSFYLRGHLSNFLDATSLGYRVVNTWRTTDDEPAPYAPTDLNLHLFLPEGACDINNPELIKNGFLVCLSIADAKQSGGPASLDFILDQGEQMTLWNTKPPRSRAIAPSQAGRYLKDSDSYVVFYGQTSDASRGKQLGEVTLYDTLQVVPGNTLQDLWRIADVQIESPRQGFFEYQAMNKLEVGTVINNELFFDCELFAYCSNFIVPFADTGR